MNLSLGWQFNSEKKRVREQRIMWAGLLQYGIIWQHFAELREIHYVSYAMPVKEVSAEAFSLSSRPHLYFVPFSNTIHSWERFLSQPSRIRRWLIYLYYLYVLQFLSAWHIKNPCRRFFFLTIEETRLLLKPRFIYLTNSRNALERRAHVELLLPIETDYLEGLLMHGKWSK